MTVRSPKTRKKTAFVPRIIFQTAAVAGVLPACAVACGGSGALFVANFAFDAGDARLDGVAADAFSNDVVAFSVANFAFDAGDARRDGAATDASLPDAYLFSVAAIGFDAGDARGVADGSSADVFLGVAATVFDGGDAQRDADGSSDDAHRFSVAAIGFDASDADKG